MFKLKKFATTLIVLSSMSSLALASNSYPIVDTNQSKYFDDSKEISKPSIGEAFYGQDADYISKTPSYKDNGDNTITDNVTGLMWQKSYTVSSYADALKELDRLNSTDRYSDWRLPTIKELFSLMDFSGIDAAGAEVNAVGSKVTPFIDTDYFDFEYGSNGHRPIDVQLLSSSIYVGETMDGMEETTIFGLNVADGRIKGYGNELMGKPKPYTVRFVRGNEEYGVNKFVDNGDMTITDEATGLMWARYDSDESMNWKEALKWAQEMNKANYLGYSDWRVPDAKELHSIVDYSKSPQTTNTPAIDDLFYSTRVELEDGNYGYGFYWTSTTHENFNGGGFGVYIAFGEATGFFNASGPLKDDGSLESGEKTLMDVHGAGAQRSDPKSGNAKEEFPEGSGPQGDVVRIDNLVRLVRDAN